MIDYYISTDKSKLDIKIVHDYLSNRSYWAKERTLETVKRSIENSLCFGVYDKYGSLIGFARAISDTVVFAYVMDVFILEPFRKKGLGKKLMKNIVSHPELCHVKRIMLATEDAHGLYEKFGFKLTPNADKLMVLERD